MIGIIEFKKDTHERNLELIHKAKTAICELYESIEKDGIEHRIPKEEFDERRGRSGMRNTSGYRSSGRGGYREGGEMGYKHMNPYMYPPMYPYPFPGMDGQSQFEGRFTE